MSHFKGLALYQAELMHLHDKGKCNKQQRQLLRNEIQDIQVKLNSNRPPVDVTIIQLRKD